jgi:Ras GTPase-activating-like protein IQGAP2/3
MELEEGFFPNDDKTQKYGNLLYLLQSEPRHIAHLCRLVSMAEIDALLQTVMFTIYGNQYESREEHLLLTMFQVRSVYESRIMKLTSTVRPHISIRQHPRLQLAPARQHPGVAHDDHVHPKRPRTELPQSCPSR